MSTRYPCFKVQAIPANTTDYHGYCRYRGDLGSLTIMIQNAGYRVGGLADLLGVSVRTVQRAFKKTLGVSVKTWAMQCREVDMCKRLEDGQSIKQITYEVGFSHSKQIAREFRKSHGITPSEYRRVERDIPAK
jgi:AraC-like DNA-binding protein